MNARERMMVVLGGEEPDKIPLMALDNLRVGSQGGWLRRLVKRGLGVVRFIPTYKPMYRYHNFYLEDVQYSQTHYIEKGVQKYRQTYETPVGTVTGVMVKNPGEVSVSWDLREEYFVKEPRDWHVINYLFRGILDQLAPSYEAFGRNEDELGDTGIVYGIVGKTPFQRAWVELAGLERTCFDFEDKHEGFQEFIEIQRQLHMRKAEITAESPAKFIDVTDNITDVISPKYYTEYCIPFYEFYSEALKGTDKVLGAHCDGRLRHLIKEIGESPLNVIESFTIPPLGDVSLTEAKLAWADKMLFVNCPPHVNWGSPEEVKDAYAAILEEWGGKKGLIIEHSEDIPLEKLEMNLSVALDVLGY